MHIIQVSSYYPPHLGGQENAVQSLATHLARAGHAVDVITSTQGGASKGITIEDNVCVTRLPGFVFGHAPIMPAFFNTLSSLIQPGSVVHLHIGQAFTPEMVYFLAKFRSFRYIAELHIDFEPSGPAGILLPLYKRLLLRPVLRAAAVVAVLNQKTQRIIQSKYNLQDVQILNNGIDEGYFDLRRPKFSEKPPAKLKLLFVGRLSKQKNIPCLLKALTKTRRNVHLDILGAGEEENDIKNIIKSYQLEKKVTLHGRVARSQVMTFYKQSHVLLMPSLYEAQPLVLLEAMAARIPIIGTNVTGVAEHIQGIGIITPPTSDGLAKAIDEYYTQYASLPAMVQKGYKKARMLGWPKLLNKYEKLYESILAD